MSLTLMVILLLGAAVALLIAELALPTHGVLGVLSVACVLGAVGLCFWRNQWLGLALLLGCLAISPLVAVALVKIWPRTPIGRRLILNAQPDAPKPPPVQVGQAGLTVTELRPTGICEFGDERLEAIAERGTIAPGARVKVINVVDRRPIVRAV